MNLKEMFDKHDEEFLQFDSIENKRSRRPDLHAFLLLDELQPSTSDIVDAAEHDEYWLAIDCDALEKAITSDQVLELVRCGIRYDDDVFRLQSYV